ncbi:MAG: hypothetical protein BWY85_02367 [Firmicutes bacterium ADurb.Bin506]|jgi:hypothetical protein|nr:MAG: hypothetical protein BWY85_02367 [Firmicutes bacterium ADurb.Bin506]
MKVKRKSRVFSAVSAAVTTCLLVLALAGGMAVAASHNDYCIDGLSGSPLTVLVIERAPGGDAATERIASASNYIGDEFGAQAVRHIYDDNGKYAAIIRAVDTEDRDPEGPVIRAMYDTDDRELARWESWYDDECRLIRERRWESGVLVSEWETSYSEDGLTEISRRLSPGSDATTVTRTRDDLGLVVLETYEHPTNGVTSYVHEYETDEFYNWVVRRTRVAGADPEDVVITRRIIQYRTYT